MIKKNRCSASVETEMYGSHILLKNLTPFNCNECCGHAHQILYLSGNSNKCSRTVKLQAFINYAIMGASGMHKECKYQIVN